MEKKRLLALSLVVFFWTTDQGTKSFADDLKKVPEKYRATAEQIVVSDGLAGYPKLTPRIQVDQ